jgi:predicted N-acetyltransferase YhbS
MEIELRLEEEKDYKIVEALTREAFWNVHFPGCDEHLLIRNLRKAKEFIPELDFTAVYNNEIIGNIVYVKAKIIDFDKEYIILTFGPISVLPKHQNNGVGNILIEHTVLLAKELGYKAIIIYGDPEYYKRFGFKASKEYNITNNSGKYPAALLVLELYPNALHDIKGIFEEGKIYEIDEKELAEYEKGFAKKKKEITKTQERFNKLVNKYL